MTEEQIKTELKKRRLDRLALVASLANVACYAINCGLGILFMLNMRDEQYPQAILFVIIAICHTVMYRRVSKRFDEIAIEISKEDTANERGIQGIYSCSNEGQALNNCSA